MRTSTGWHVSPDELGVIARRAATLDEVLAAAAVLDRLRPPVTGDDPSGAAAYERWCKAFSDGDHESFRRRLSWDGLSEAGVRTALAAAGHAEAPAASRYGAPWAEQLRRILDRLPSLAGGLTRGGRPPEVEGFQRGSPPAFAEVWIPFVRFARSGVVERAGDATRRLADGALEPLERHLLRQVSEVAADAAYARFDEYRGGLASRGAGSDRGESGNGRAIYASFVDALLSGGIVGFFKEYGVLARQIVRLIDTWIAGTTEFLDRLDRDADDVRRTFHPGGTLGEVVRVEAGLSDRHRGGRRVLALTYRDGLRLIYKPRDVGLESAFGSFLEWAGAAGLESVPGAVRVLARSDYGSEVREYYRRAGCLLFLAHLLGGRDLHMENVVAGRGGPYLVDAETLLQPRLVATGARGPARGADERVQETLGDSFVGTGLLSRGESDRAGVVREIGGLCGRGGWSLGDRSCWLAPNTDAMRRGIETASAPDGRNALRLGGEVQPPERFGAELAAGFAAAYRFALEHRDVLLDPDGPLRPFRAHPTRLVLRPTNLYATVQVRLATARYQREGLTRSFLIDSLNRVFRFEAERPLLWPLTADERGALEGLDVPLFSVPVDGTEIAAVSGEVIRGFLAASGAETVRERLRRLDTDDLTWQLDVMAATLVGTPAALEGHDRVAAPGAPVSGFSPSRVEPLPPEELVAAARTLAEEIRGRAVTGDDGSAMWVMPAHLRLDGREDRGLAYDLYHGAAGVILFLAAFGRVTGERTWGDLARAGARTIAAAMERSGGGNRLVHERIGACSGLGGVAYSLACAARLLDDPSFAGLASRVGAAITVDRIRNDSRIDVEGGAAGAALGLLALYDVTGDPSALERAVACAEHLAATQAAAPAGGAAWADRDGLMQAGFAHGAAGVAYALTRVQRVAGDRRFLEPVRRARAFLRTAYAPGDANWPALVRQPDGSVARVVMNAWCHGAPGIALAVSAERAAAGDGEVCPDLETALAATAAVGLLGSDHMCCGNIGVTEIMSSVGHDLGRAELIRAAGLRARAVVARARESGGFRLQPSAPGRHAQPGFFRGTAGVGYGLLRLARPQELPPVLSFHVPAGGTL